MKSETHLMVEAPAALPQGPRINITAASRWRAIDLRELWEYRELLWFMAVRDVKLRYKQTALGAAWAMLQPLLTMVIFTLLFGKFAGMPSNGHPYALFAYAGLLPWTFFANAITGCGSSLVINSNLVTKVYFPRLIIPLATVLAGLVDFGISLALFFCLAALYRVRPTWTLLALPVLIALTVVLAMAIGSFFAALNVKYRDIRYALPFLVQLGMFVTPIIYPSALVPEKWRWILHWNPLAAIVEGYRTALLGGPFDLRSLFTAGLLVLGLFAAGAYYFRSVENGFADEL